MRPRICSPPPGSGGREAGRRGLRGRASPYWRHGAGHRLRSSAGNRAKLGYAAPGDPARRLVRLHAWGRPDRALGCGFAATGATTRPRL